MRLLLPVVLCVVLFAACHNGEPAKEQTTATTVPAAPPPPAVPASALGNGSTKDMMTLISAYYELKDALVAADAAKADAAGSRVLSAAETMHHATVPDAAAHATFQAYVDTVMNQSEALVNVKDTTCARKRVYFEKVSDALYGMAKAVDLKGAGVYRQYCPMAFNDKGAYWLSHESEIKNPYFGRKMLECGEVRDSL